MNKFFKNLFAKATLASFSFSIALPLLVALLTFSIAPSDNLMAQDWGVVGPRQYYFNYEGNWSATADYNSNDAVRGGDGKLYVAVEDNVPRNTNPVGSMRYWAEAVSSRGNPGAIGPMGNSKDSIFIASETQPTLPTAPTYSNGDFANINPWSNNVPITGTVWMAIYTVSASNAVSDPDLIQLTRTGDTGATGNTGEKGNSIDAIFIRAASRPSLPADNTGTRVGDEITVAPSGWQITAEATTGNNDLYIVLARLPGGNLTIDYFTMIKFSGEVGRPGSQGSVGNTGAKGDTGNQGNSFGFVFQRKTGAAPSLPVDNTGTRSGAELSSAPSGWNLGDPGGGDPLYIAIALLPGANTNINWIISYKSSGERGGDGTNGENGFTERTIFRKANQYDYNVTPVVTYDGTTLSVPTQWSVDPYVSQKFEDWTLPTTTPQDIAVDLDTNIILTLAGDNVYRNNLRGTADTTKSVWDNGLRSNNNSPVSLAVIADEVYVLDSFKRSVDNNFVYRVFIYDKVNGAFKRTIDLVYEENDQPPLKLAYNSSKLYVISNRISGTMGDAIKSFSLAGVEDTTAPLDTLPSYIDNVVGFEADDLYFYIVDGTDNKVYLLDRTDPLRRRASLEFDLDSTHTNPIGLALSEFEAHIIQGQNNMDFVYYNPNNILYGSKVLFRQGVVGGVASSDIFWVTPLRSEGEGSTTTIVQQISGGGGSGTMGTMGNSLSQVFIKSQTRPATPTITQGRQSNGLLTAPPPGWELTTTAAEAQAGTGNIWISWVILSGDGSTILSYQPPIDFGGARGPPGASIEVVYQRSASQPTTPTANSGSTAANGYELATAPPGWHLHVSRTTGNETLWLSLVSITENGRTYEEPVDFGGEDGENAPHAQFQYSTDNSTWVASVANPSYIRVSTDGGTTWSIGFPFGKGDTGAQGTNAPQPQVQYSIDGSTGWATSVSNPYFIRFSVDGGNTWGTGHRFRMDGTDGTDGNSTDIIYRRSATAPTIPADGTGTWNGTDYDPPTNWFESDPDPASNLHLYSTDVKLSGTDQTSSGITYEGLYRRTPEDGNHGTNGINGNSNRVLYTKKSGQAPNRPRNITYDGTNFGGLTQTDGQVWAATIPVGNDPLYKVEVLVNGQTNAVTILGDPYRPETEGPPGAFEKTFYQRAATQPVTGLLNTQYNYDTQVYTNTGSWLTSAPSGTAQLWKLVAMVPARSTEATVTIAPTANIFSDRGETGSIGNTGATGRWPVTVWTRSASRPGVPTTLEFNQSGDLTSNTAGGHTWYTDPAAATGNEQLWRTGAYLDINVNPPTKDWLGTPIEDGKGDTGAASTVRGPVGPASTVPGPRGNGTQTIFRRSATPVSGIPSNAGITATNGTLDNAPSGWLLSDPGGSNPLYLSTANIPPTGAITFSQARRETPIDGTQGTQGISNKLFFFASTANTVSAPNIDYSGSPPSFNNLGGWLERVPTTPAGANIFSMPVEYTPGVAGSDTELGVALFGTVPGSAAPAGAQTYTLPYGTITGGPAWTATQTTDTLPTLSLAAGATGSFNISVVNSAANPNYYFDLPDGLTLVNVYNTAIGEVLATPAWTTKDPSENRRYINSEFDPITRLHLRIEVRRQ